MRKLFPYKGVEFTLEKMKIQIADSLPYCYQHFNNLKTPEQVWNAIKPKIKYISDPPGLELLQTVPTLLDAKKNWHKIPGAGDCDCFTIFALSVLYVNKYVNKYAVLVGNNINEPSHIYAGVKYKGRFIALDFTNPAINIERPYKYRQILPFTL